MKKIICLALSLILLTSALLGCSKTPEHFTGEWRFSKIRSVEIYPLADESLINDLKKEYNAADEAGVEAAALAQFTADNTFGNCYLNFDGDRAYTYDPIMERESTWAIYLTGDNGGFISVYTELDVADGNPDPITNPVMVYEAESGVMLLTVKYVAYMVTLELTR